MGGERIGKSYRESIVISRAVRGRERSNEYLKAFREMGRCGGDSTRGFAWRCARTTRDKLRESEHRLPVKRNTSPKAKGAGEIGI